MNNEVGVVVREAVLEILNSSITNKKIQESFAKHQNKVHFVPIRYRVMGGILQSLNIKFGNFIEKLIELLAEADSNVEVMPISGKKIEMAMTAQTDTMIDQYITARQKPDSPDQCDDQFMDLVDEIIKIETSSDIPKQIITKDVDFLFLAESGEKVYLEIKYNDDHDTGKFVDINRKFLKSYAGLVNELGITEKSQLKPILYYFNPLKRWGPVYVPSSNIFRGSQLFDIYITDFKFEDIDSYLHKISEDEEVVNLFDDLYQRVRYKFE